VSALLCVVNAGNCLSHGGEMVTPSDVTVSPSHCSHDESQSDHHHHYHHLGHDEHQSMPCSAIQCCLVLLNAVRAHAQSINVMRCNADHVITASSDHTLKVSCYSCGFQLVFVLCTMCRRYHHHHHHRSDLFWSTHCSTVSCLP